MPPERQLTRGPIGRQLAELAAPLILGNILQQLYNTIDAVIVGRFVGQAAFGAVGIAGSVMNLFLFLLTGVCTGVGILLSQLYGAGDRRGFRRTFFLAAVSGAALAAALTALSLAALEPLLAALRTPAAMSGYAGEYLRIIFLGFPAAFAYQLGAAVLRSAGDTRAALGFLVLSMGANLAMDLAFVAGLPMGVSGAALATVIAQALAAGLCLCYLRWRFPALMFGRADMALDVPLLGRAARLSCATALHMCSLYIGKLLVQGTVNSLGEEAAVAYTAATRVEDFANSFGDSGAASMSVFIGQNTGARDGGRVRAGFFTGERLLCALGLFMAAAMLLGAEPCLRLVLPAGSGGSLGPAMGYFRLVACFYLFNFLGSGLAGYFQGRGRPHIPVLGAAGHISLRVVLSALLAPRMGLPAVALATGLGWVGVVAFWWALVRRDLRRAGAETQVTSARRTPSEECPRGCGR